MLICERHLDVKLFALHLFLNVVENEGLDGVRLETWMNFFLGKYRLFFTFNTFNVDSVCFTTWFLYFADWRTSWFSLQVRCSLRTGTFNFLRNERGDSIDYDNELPEISTEHLDTFQVTFAAVIDIEDFISFQDAGHSCSSLHNLLINPLSHLLNSFLLTFGCSHLSSFLLLP